MLRLLLRVAQNPPTNVDEGEEWRQHRSIDRSIHRARSFAQAAAVATTIQHLLADPPCPSSPSGHTYLATFEVREGQQHLSGNALF
jgi:hypothetical protein